MYYYEQDYIMRLIHGIAAMLARMLFGERIPESGEPSAVMEETCREQDDLLRGMVDAGRINAAENRLFDLLENAAWDDRQKAALVLSFYGHVNGKDDDFLAAADFSREEIIRGMEDAMKAVHFDLPEYMRI